MPCHDVADLLTVSKTNMINKMPCGCGTLRSTAVSEPLLSENHCCLSTTAVRIWHKVSDRACAEVSAALKVSRRAALRSQLLSKSSVDLH